MENSRRSRKPAVSIVAALIIVALCTAVWSRIQKEKQRPPDAFEEAITLAWMSDTQYYSETYPEIFSRMTSWLTNESDTLRLRYVLHTGDVVDDFSKEEQWSHAQKALSAFSGQLPLMLAAGNHDIGHGSLNYAAYTAHMAAALRPLAEADLLYADGRGCYDTFSAGGKNYLLLFIGYGVDEEAVDWLNRVAAAYPHHTVILGTHSYLNMDGSRTEDGQRLWREVIRPNANIRLVLCGHNHGVLALADELDDNGDGQPDRIVHQLMADYQNEDRGGNGYLRLLRIEESGQMHVATYSPYLQQTNCFEEGDSFDIQLDLVK